MTGEPAHVSTAPKPFVFVLMPYDAKFNDIYKFGIKGAAEDAGAYAERVDEQLFTEGILDRVFNQIAKADVVVADMTGRNPNVFYEVGYAHALDKVVLLLTQVPSDIPFDLKQRPHIIYEGSIHTLRAELGRRIRWAVAESAARDTHASLAPIAVRLAGTDLHATVPGGPIAAPPTFQLSSESSPLTLTFTVVNRGPTPMAAVTHAYLLFADASPWTPSSLESWSHTGTSTIYSLGATIPVPLPALGVAPDAPPGLDQSVRVRLGAYALEVPPGAMEEITVSLARQGTGSVAADFALRLHVGPRVLDYRFRLEARQSVKPVSGSQ